MPNSRRFDPWGCLLDVLLIVGEELLMRLLLLLFTANVLRFQIREACV